MTHPLLTKVLATALDFEYDQERDHPEDADLTQEWYMKPSELAAGAVKRIHLSIADRLERALHEGCAGCLHSRSSHDMGWDAAGCMVGSCHCPYQPLVQP